MILVEMEDESYCNGVLHGGTLKLVSEFVYLGAMIDKNCEWTKEKKNCVDRTRIVRNAMNILARKKKLSMNSVRELYKGMLVPILPCSSEILR